MVREDEEPKKRGWFSRKKKSSASTPRTPRPPTVSSSPAHHRKGSSQTTVDEDLPPREGSPSTPTAGTPSLGTPIAGPSSQEAFDGDISSPGTPAIPKHAGFDFTAIKEVIGKADLNAEELQIPTPSRFHAPTIPPPTRRLESAPPPAPESPSPTSASRSSLELRELPVAGPSSSSVDLPSTLSRSMSLNDMRSEMDEEELASVDEHTPTSSQTFRITPQRQDSAQWPEEAERTLPPSATNPFSGSALDARSAYDVLRPSGSGSYGLSRLPDNPFAPPDSATLSFGAADGSITFNPPSATTAEPPDPWNIATPSFGGFRKPSNSFNVNSNPWQS